MKTDFRTELLAQWYTHNGDVMLLTRFSEVPYQEIYTVGSQTPSIFQGQTRTKYVIGIAVRDCSHIEDFMIDLYPGYKSSNETWRRDFFRVRMDSRSMFAEDVRRLLSGYRVYFEDDPVGLMTAWIDDRVEHEVEEYKKWCKEQK